jgi:hypothetical protein
MRSILSVLEVSYCSLNAIHQLVHIRKIICCVLQRLSNSTRFGRFEERIDIASYCSCSWWLSSDTLVSRCWHCIAKVAQIFALLSGRARQSAWQNALISDANCASCDVLRRCCSEIASNSRKNPHFASTFCPRATVSEYNSSCWSDMERLSVSVRGAFSPVRM